MRGRIVKRESVCWRCRLKYAFFNELFPSLRQTRFDDLCAAHGDELWADVQRQFLHAVMDHARAEGAASSTSASGGMSGGGPDGGRA